MKKKTILAVFAAMAIALSANGQTSGGANQLTVKTYKDSLIRNVGDIECDAHISIDYPVSGSPVLVNNIRKWMLSEMGYKSEAIPANASPFVKYYLNNSIEDINDMAADLEENPFGLGYSCSREIKKIYESPKFVTFGTSGYNYTGGVHGLSYYTGVTFSKSNGRKLGKNMLNMARQTEIRRLIEKYLLPYFGVSSTREMKSMLFMPEGTTIVPLPEAEPYIEDNKMVFIYQQYEIAPYAAGMPEARIPIKVIMPYLSTMFKSL